MAESIIKTVLKIVGLCLYVNEIFKFIATRESYHGIWAVIIYIAIMS